MRRLLFVIVALLLCDFVAFSASESESLSSVGSLETISQNECVIAQQSGRSCLAVGETNYVVSPSVKVVENHDYISECDFLFGNSHLINYAVITSNSRLIGFSRSVDKYIYALHHLII